MNPKRIILNIFVAIFIVLSNGILFADPIDDIMADLHPTTEPTTPYQNPESEIVIEYHDYSKDKGDRVVEPGSLSGDVNMSTIGRGLYYDGKDFYFFTDTGIMATNYMYTIQGDKFYFGEDGKMVKDTLVEYDGELYYFDSNGAMFKNRWYTEEQIDEYDNTITYVDYYFGPSGRAHRAPSGAGLVLKTIEGQKFGFNEDAEKLEGYVNAEGVVLDTTDDEAYADCLYYFDPDDNGAAYSGWLEYLGSNRGDYDSTMEMYLYFDEKTSRKVASRDSDKFISRTIDGQRYMFDYNGVRKKEWYGNNATGSTVRYFNEEYDGYMSKGWFLAVPGENCIEPVNVERHNDDEEVWFYASSDGNILRSCIRKIGSYTYAFDADGVMQEDRLVVVKNGTYVRSYETGDITKKQVLYGAEDGGILNDGERWMYFITSDEEDKVGIKCKDNVAVKLELKDEDVSFFSNNAGGYGSSRTTTAVQRGGKYVQNGVLLMADKDNSTYGIIRENKELSEDRTVSPFTGEPVTTAYQSYSYIVVNNSGKVITTQWTVKKDKNGAYVYLGYGGEYLGTYSVQGRAQSAGGKASWEYKDPITNAWKSGFPPREYRVEDVYMYLNFDTYENGVADLNENTL